MNTVIKPKTMLKGPVKRHRFKRLFATKNLIRQYLYTAVLVLILICACEEPQHGAAKFRVINTSLGLKDYNAPFILITIENFGSAPAYNVFCEIIAKSETRIVDSGYAYFNLGDQILPGERFIDEAVFHQINSHDDYRSLEYKFNWTAVE